MEPKDTPQHSTSTLSLRALLSAALILLLSLALSGTFEYLRSKDHATQQASELSLMFGRSSAILIQPLVLADDRISLNYLFNELASQPLINGLRLTAPDQTLIALAGQPQGRGHTLELAQGNEIIGHLTLWSNAQPFAASLQRQLQEIALLLAASLGITALLIAFSLKQRARLDAPEAPSFGEVARQVVSRDSRDSIPEFDFSQPAGPVEQATTAPAPAKRAPASAEEAHPKSAALTATSPEPAVQDSDRIPEPLMAARASSPEPAVAAKPDEQSQPVQRAEAQPKELPEERAQTAQLEPAQVPERELEQPSLQTTVERDAMPAQEPPKRQPEIPPASENLAEPHFQAPDADSIPDSDVIPDSDAIPEFLPPGPEPQPKPEPKSVQAHPPAQETKPAQERPERREPSFDTDDLVSLLRPEQAETRMPRFTPKPSNYYEEDDSDEAMVPDMELTETDNAAGSEPEEAREERDNPLRLGDEEQLGLYTFEQELEMLLTPENAGYLFLIDTRSAHSENLDGPERDALLKNYRTLANSVARIYSGSLEALKDGNLRILFTQSDDKDSHGVNAICCAMLFTYLYQQYNQQQIRAFQPVMNLHMSLVRGALDKVERMQEEAHFLSRTTQSNALISHTALTEAPLLKDSLLSQADIRREDEDKVLLLAVNASYQNLLEKQARHLLSKLAERQKADPA